MAYEEKSINDMMNRALVNYDPSQQNNDAPRVGYLVKARKSTKRDGNDIAILKRLDIYRLPRGTTLQDAAANRNGATHEAYSPGDPEVVIRVTAQDLGIPVRATGIPRDFEMHASDLLKHINPA